MANHLSLPTLILNSSWQPISVASVRHAIVKVTSGLASILEPEFNNLHDIESWMELIVPENQEGIALPHDGQMRIPEIIVLKNYNRFPRRDVKLTRRNLLVRDGFRCQYTGRIVSASEATIDHVFPASRGGKLTWENAVISCIEANRRKADRTPEEAGMKLLRSPRKPEWSPIYSRFSRLTSASKVPQSWRNFISEKWDADTRLSIEAQE
jgi:5-methylcytosine-specific restriction endonuclease McrA